MTVSSWASRTRFFSYGGELGNYETYEVDGIINSEQNVKALEMYRELYGFTPPGWAKTFFVENNQAITENLAAMSMNYFRVFPGTHQRGVEPECQGDRLLRQSGGSGRPPVSPHLADRAFP